MAFLLFAGGLSVWFFAGVQLLSRNRQPIHFCMAAGCGAAGYVMLYGWAVSTGVLSSFPILWGSDIGATLFAASAFYLASLSVLHEGKRPVRSYLVYFVIPILFALLFGLSEALTVPLSGKQMVAESHYTRLSQTVFTVISHLALTFAIVFDLVAAFRLKRAARVKDLKGFRYQVIFLLLYLGASLVLLAADWLRDENLYLVGILLFCPIILAYALTHMAVFYFPREAVATPRPVPPEWGAGAEGLTIRLERLMKNVAPYRDPDLTLKRLAQLLGVEPKRLTYHLHSCLSTNFRRYIDEWRLKAVCQDLVARPERTILETAFENGFNSKSSFNTLFLQAYGKTPRDFKKQAAKVGPGQ